MVDLQNFFSEINDECEDIPFVPTERCVIRFIDRKTKKAIKSIWKFGWKKVRKTRKVRYISHCFDNEYEHFYEGGGEIHSEMQIDSERMFEILQIYRKKQKFRVVYWV